MISTSMEKRVTDRIFVDTVFVVALINDRDQYHLEAIEWGEKIEGQRLLITEAILLEIGNQLARNHRDEAVEVIEDFLTSDETEVVHLTPDLFLEALAMYKTHQDKTWSLVDCISFVVMRRAGVTTALTTDRH